MSQISRIVSSYTPWVDGYVIIAQDSDRALGFRVHHAVQTAQHPDGVDAYDVIVLDGLPAWVL